MSLPRANKEYGSPVYNSTILSNCGINWKEYKSKAKGSNQTIENCVLFINQEVPARGMALVEVICDALADPNLEIEDVFGFNQKPEFKGVNPELESKLLSNLTVLQN